MMKTTSCFVLLATLGFNTAVVANAATPSVTGTVTKVVRLGNERQVTVNGHTYIMTADTKSDGTSATLQPGQPVTLFLSNDGHDVIMAHTPTSTPAHP